VEKQNEIRKIKALVERLSNWYWSPLFPTSYTINGRGLGKLALTDPAAFNLTWAKHQSKLATLDDHKEAITYFVQVGKLLEVNVNQTTLGSYVTLYSQATFSKWYNTTVKQQLPTRHRELIDQAIHDTVRKL
jgi:hypothetical protein